MHIIIVAIMVAVVCVIGMMLQRIYQGPTVYDRMNGLGVTGAGNSSTRLELLEENRCPYLTWHDAVKNTSTAT